MDPNDFAPSPSNKHQHEWKWTTYEVAHGQMLEGVGLDCCSLPFSAIWKFASTGAFFGGGIQRGLRVASAEPPKALALHTATPLRF